VDGIAQGGDGVGRWEGRAVFAGGGLPGERVRVRLRERQRSFARGVVVEVLEVAPERIPSPCPLEDHCGGADWRWIDYDAQLRFKAAILKDQMRHLGGIEVEVAAVHGMDDQRPTTDDQRLAIDETEGISSSDDRRLGERRTPARVAGPGWSYRTTAELHIAGGTIGYYAPGSRRVAPVPQCCLHHPLIDEALGSLQAMLHPDLGLRGVTLRCSPTKGAVLAILEGDPPVGKLAERWMAVTPALRGVLQRRGRALKLVRGEDHLIQEIDGVRWYVSASSFFQVNDRQTLVLIRRVLDLIEARKGERVLDLFCGVGAFALPLAGEGTRVTGVESYPPAIEDARRSAELNGIVGADWHAGPVEKVLGNIEGSFDAAVLDPPRRGCEPEALAALLSLRPARIVYVSCHPGTLARDCKILRGGGYEVERAEVIDLFPHTHHVESIVLLRRRS